MNLEDCLPLPRLGAKAMLSRWAVRWAYDDQRQANVVIQGFYAVSHASSLLGY